MKRIALVCSIVFFLSVGIAPGNCCDPSFSAAEMVNFTLDTPFSLGHLFQPFKLLERIGCNNMPELLDEVGGLESHASPLDTILFIASMCMARTAAPSPAPGIHGRFLFQGGGIRFSFMRDMLATGSWQTAVLNVTVPSVVRACLHDNSGKILFIDEIDAGVTASLVTSWPPLLLHHAKAWNRDGMLLEWAAKGDHPE